MGACAAAGCRLGPDRWVARISSRFLPRCPHISPLGHCDDGWVSAADHSGPNCPDFGATLAHQHTTIDSND
jgi:hypothetical protein